MERFCRHYDGEKVYIGAPVGRDSFFWIGARSDGRVYIDGPRVYGGGDDGTGDSGDSSDSGDSGDSGDNDIAVDGDGLDGEYAWEVVCHPLENEFLLKNVAHGSYLAPPANADDPVAAENGPAAGRALPERFWWDIVELPDDFRLLATFRECNNVLGVRGPLDGEQLFVNSGRGMMTVFAIAM